MPRMVLSMRFCRTTYAGVFSPGPTLVVVIGSTTASPFMALDVWSDVRDVVVLFYDNYHFSM